MKRQVSRQRLWQRRQVKLGRCQICGQKRPPELRLLCRPCQKKANALHMKLYYQRQREAAHGQKKAA